MKKTDAREAASELRHGWRPVMASLITVYALSLWPSVARADSAEEFVRLGERIHGGFGSYVALGVRIGLDARERLQAKGRQLEVTLFDGPTSPCPCIADGLLLSTLATPGRGTLRVSMQPAGYGQLGVVLVRDRESEEILRFTIPDTLRARLDEWNRTDTPLARYEALMSAPAAELYVVETLGADTAPHVH